MKTLVVPVKGDRVTTRDDSDPRVVSSYTSLKDLPAVYLTPGSSSERFIYFSDIVELNGVRVELDKASGCLRPLGPLRRLVAIPQEGDTVEVELVDGSSLESIKVTKVTLLDRKQQHTLLVCGESSCFALDDLRSINPVGGFGPTRMHRLLRYYHDYLPLR